MEHTRLHMMTEKSKDRQEALDHIRRQGLSVPKWSEKNGFPVRSVRAVLYGHNKGNYGQSHKIAVALRMKAQGCE